MIPEQTASLPTPRRKFAFDSRFIAPVFISLILIVGHLYFGILEDGGGKTALAIAASILTELVLGRIFIGRWPHLASAYVSGISVGILIRSPYYWPYALCSMIAITSKYLIRVKGRHLWNPSNFAIVVMLVLAYDAVATLSVQWGNTLLPMFVIWTLGSIIVWRLHRLHICATYVAAFFAFAFLRSAITGHTWQSEIAPITGPMYQLFVFFMITDPKTTVSGWRGQCLVAFLIALMECVLRLGQAVHAPYYALFLVGPAANLIDIYRSARRDDAAAPSARPVGSANSSG